jgi:beta-glucuronidase
MNKRFSLIILFILLLTNSSAPQTATLQSSFYLKSLNAVKIPFQNGIPVPTFEKQNRQVIDLNGTWKKQRFSANHDISLAARDSIGYANLVSESQNRFSPDYDDGSWDTKNIPSVENTMYTYPKVPEYYEDGVWYRRSFSIPDSIQGKFVKLMFYAVNYTSDVWINGHYLGYHEGGYTSFAFDVSAYLNYNSPNIIAIRVDNPPWGKRIDIVPYTVCDWFNYTGIIHDVYLEASDPVSIIRGDVIPLDTTGKIQTAITLFNKSGQLSSVNIQMDIYNANVDSTNIQSEMASALIGLPAQVTGNKNFSVSIDNDSTAMWKTILQVNNPALWSPKSPNLYIMKITLSNNGNIIDSYYTQFGIRRVETKGVNVLLNGKPVFFTGIARHEDHPVFGRSIPDSIIYSDLVRIKNLNVNMIRTAHYPNSPYTYLIADRMGFAITEEIPVWQFDNSDAFIIQNNSRHIHQQMFREMVFRDCNRPSILFWSTCNECLDETNRAVYIQTIKNDLRNNYNDGRLLTQSAAADRPGPQDPSEDYCDVASWTMYFGIFYGKSYYDDTKQFLQTANISHPDKPIMSTEFGYWSSEDNSTRSTQAAVFFNTFKAFMEAAAINSDGTINSNSGYLMGVTWWCAFDWYTAGHPYGFQSMGIYSMDRNTRKFVANYMVPEYQPYFDIGGMLITGINDKASFNSKKMNFNLYQNYPNPFNPVTSITFSLQNFSTVTLKVYDMLGKEVLALIDNQKYSPGVHVIKTDMNKLSSGVYFYRIVTDKFSAAKKMLLLK